VDPKTSVLDPGGECWECAGVYCCDGSAMPTPSGVNPMISIEAVAYLLAGGIARRAVAAKAASGPGARRGRRGEVKYGDGTAQPAPPKL